MSFVTKANRLGGQRNRVHIAEDSNATRSPFRDLLYKSESRLRVMKLKDFLLARKCRYRVRQVAHGNQAMK